MVDTETGIRPMIRFLVNPAAGNGRGRRALERLGSLAARAGADLRTSRDAEDLEEQSRTAVAEGVTRTTPPTSAWASARPAASCASSAWWWPAATAPSIA